ncbi:MAG: hypothetical protein CM1200mP10_04010 [Candidatus Neomarinimicrobiota bacterium]|nr:MAG: hypothetical protein CM1200mP10_04010 [Candidatus Neomarinimicrobiota bacterium]
MYFSRELVCPQNLECLPIGGKGGVWHKYNWEDYACQAAFIRDPEAVLDFHETRRRVLIDCLPHAGHELISDLEKNHENVWIITQNIDGMHQRAGSKNIVELHGSAWRLRCDHCEIIIEDHNPEHYNNWKCDNDHWLRPDIVWFNDFLIPAITQMADEIISKSDLFYFDRNFWRCVAGCGFSTGRQIKRCHAYRD